MHAVCGQHHRQPHRPFSSTDRHLMGDVGLKASIIIQSGAGL